jgi:hypothetical protein
VVVGCSRESCNDRTLEVAEEIPEINNTRKVSRCPWKAVKPGGGISKPGETNMKSTYPLEYARVRQLGLAISGNYLYR